MNVIMTRIAQGRKESPWISGMDERMPPGTPVWFGEETVYDRGRPFHRQYVLEVSRCSDAPTSDHLRAHGWFVPHGAVVPM